MHVQNCDSCGELNMYPRARCPHCYSSDLSWIRVSGKGTLLSYTVVRAASPNDFAEDTPYCIGIVKLSEGPQLLVRLSADEDGEFSSYQCDMSVQFMPAPTEEIARRPVAWFQKG
ncbi:Zn-ribbon domain-containing OB-fold protein [Advenella incenata]|nr:OB-fold domain-containing protein [Advenella incenata]